MLRNCKSLQGLKPAYLLGSNGTAGNKLRKTHARQQSEPQALKREGFSMAYGTNKFVPFPLLLPGLFPQPVEYRAPRISDKSTSAN
jgi:hypothetical protein